MTHLDRTLRLGTRGSALARTQSGLVVSALEALGARVELVPIVTHGDRSAAPLAEIGGTGVFVAAVRDALLAGRCDLAVHSLKDLPVGSVAGLTLAALPARADVRDALCTRDGLTLAELAPGATVGTGSHRRALFLAAQRPDLRIVGLRGNVDSRLGRVRSGELDAVVLAAAGLERLGLLGEVGEFFAPLDAPPAPGQGALAIECRIEDEPVAALLAGLDDGVTRLAVTAERAVLGRLDAGCTAPIGAWGRVEGDELALDATIWRDGDESPLRAAARVPLAQADPDELGVQVADDLLRQGAAEIEGIGAAAAPRIVVPIPTDRSDRWADCARAAGLVPVPIDLLHADFDQDESAVLALVERLRAGEFTHLAFTSARTVGAIARVESDLATLQTVGGFRVAAIGPATAAAAARAGLTVHVAPISDHSAAGLATALAAAQPRVAAIAIPHSNLADGRIGTLLRDAGWEVTDVTAYRIVPQRADAAAIIAARPALVFLTSGSAVRSWDELTQDAADQDATDQDAAALRTIKAVTLGASATEAAAAAGIDVIATARSAATTALTHAMRNAHEMVTGHNGDGETRPSPHPTTEGS